jgi:hypothetical protein
LLQSVENPLAQERKFSSAIPHTFNQFQLVHFPLNQAIMAPAFHGYKPDLWSFQFLKGNDVMLRVEDFTVGLLFLEESEVADLLAQS